jgi:hypothetical protein
MGLGPDPPQSLGHFEPRQIRPEQIQDQQIGLQPFHRPDRLAGTAGEAIAFSPGMPSSTGSRRSMTMNWSSTSRP